MRLEIVILVWAILSLIAGFAAGWVIGRYGYRDEKPPARQMLPVRRLMAANLADTNRLEVKQGTPGWGCEPEDR